MYLNATAILMLVMKFVDDKFLLLVTDSALLVRLVMSTFCHGDTHYDPIESVCKKVAPTFFTSDNYP